MLSKYMKTKRSAFISIFAIFFAAIISSVLIALFVLLIKQIQILSLDSSSFQAYYTADSAMECVMYKEKAAAYEAYEESSTTNTTVGVWTTTLFRRDNWDKLTGCVQTGDIDKPNLPIETNSRSQSQFNLKLDQGNNQFCGLVYVDRNLTDSSSTNIVSVTGRSAACSDTSGGRVVERGIDLVY
jgi:hypothetical protein